MKRDQPETDEVPVSTATTPDAVPPNSAVRAPPGGPRQKFKRSYRNYLLDPHFQLKYTGYLVGLAVAVSLALGFVLYRQSEKTIQLGNEAVEVGSEANEAGRASVSQSRSLTDIIEINADTYYKDDPTLLATMQEENKKETEKIEGRARALAASEHKLKDQRMALERQRTILFSTLAGALVFLVVFLGLGGIVITHKVSGPIFKMKRLLREVGDGKLVVPGKLRKGDELQDFFDVFAQMVEKLRARQEKEISILDSAMAIAQTESAPPQLRDRLVDLRSVMQGQLDAK